MKSKHKNIDQLDGNTSMDSDTLCEYSDGNIPTLHSAPNPRLYHTHYLNPLKPSQTLQIRIKYFSVISLVKGKQEANEKILQSQVPRYNPMLQNPL